MVTAAACEFCRRKDALLREGTACAQSESMLMPLRIGFLSCAHMHAWGYARAVQEDGRAEISGIWDSDPKRSASFAERFGIESFADADALCSVSDAGIVCSENRKHAEHAAMAASRGCHILCEKPLVTSHEEFTLMTDAVAAARVQLMTAFPCRYAPTFRRLCQRIEAGEIGKVVAVCATNRGRCPFGWFTDAELSGGGAMMDHTVHVVDLLSVLLGEEPVRVQAQIGNNLHGESWEDTAMLTLEYASGVFATLDSSWSRPRCYKTWGDVTMNVVGESGVLEADLFGQHVERYDDGAGAYTAEEFGSDLDSALIADFLSCVEQGRPPPISAEDGWLASKVALAGYRSARSGQVVQL
jgi:predicted dehydrogenase